MAVFAPLVSQYSVNTYLTGKQRFTARDGYTGVPTSYVDPVKGYAAKNFYIDDLDTAKGQGWINQQEYDETMALKTETDPLYRPNPVKTL